MVCASTMWVLKPWWSCAWLIASFAYRSENESLSATRAAYAIASSMDLIFAADDAKFLPSMFQYFSVPWDLGARKTKEILFESRFVSAQEAMETGLVSRVVPAADLDDEVMAYASRVAENDAFQLRMIKLAVNQAQDAQGFRTAVQGAHSLYTLRAIDGGTARTEGKRRLIGVEKAFEREPQD